MRPAMNGTSGTDDGLPNQAIFQSSRGVIFSGAMRVSSGLVPHASNLTDMDFQIHCTETEAYSAVLRAFIAQSDVLSWGKEGLITELRKELRVSDVEHREILGKINSDESIKSLRERRKSTDDQLLSFDPSMKHMPSKKLKVGNIKVPSSPNFPACAQPSTAVIPSSLAVRTSTSTQVRDGKRCGDGALSPQMNVIQTVGPAPVNRHVPDAGKLEESLILQTSKRGPVHSGFASLKPGSNIIDIRATDKLLHEVRTVCRSENPNPAHVEKARFILREHERALMYAIGKLADLSDGDDSPDKNMYRCSNEEQQWNGCGHHRVVYKQFRRTKDCYSAFRNDLAVNAGESFIADDEYNQAH